MNFKFFLLVLFVPLAALPQTYSLKGYIKNIDQQQVTIHDFYGGENRKIDSVNVKPDGYFEYQFPAASYSGMYRLRWDSNHFMDILFNHENITFETDARSVVDSLVFFQSVENQLYFDYLKHRNETEYRLELLHPLLNLYPAEDPFYEKITDQYDLINNELKKYVEDLLQMHPETYAAKLINADFTPRPKSSLNEEEHIEFLRTHFFDRIDFFDTTLLFSNIIATKVIQYLSLYQDNRLDKDQLQVEFIKAVSVIMSKTMDSPIVYEFAMDYLITGFNNYGFDKVITYIADNINLEDQCYDSERKAELEKKVESLKKFAVGIKAPDFAATDLNGNQIKLSGISSEYTLLLFWATWCPHCNVLVQELQKLYLEDNRQKFEIVAVSLDDSPKDLQTFLQQGNYNWINIADFKKWKGELVQLYDIFATPTMFLLRKDLTIEAKPMTFNELKNDLFTRNILE
ncbi:MAG: redoxin domain-containing protein [Sphingobacteriia bacterium]|nr:redoxin domain-containing protein [Sphingobacteriia bacterium]